MTTTVSVWPNESVERDVESAVVVGVVVGRVSVVEVEVEVVEVVEEVVVVDDVLVVCPGSGDVVSVPAGGAGFLGGPRIWRGTSLGPARAGP